MFERSKLFEAFLGERYLSMISSDKAMFTSGRRSAFPAPSADSAFVAPPLGPPPLALIYHCYYFHRHIHILSLPSPFRNIYSQSETQRSSTA